MKRLLLAGLLFTAAVFASPTDTVVQRLQTNGDPATIDEGWHWPSLPAATRKQALSLVDAWLTTHPQTLQAPVPLGGGGGPEPVRYSWPRLYLAALRGQVDIVKLLLDRGASMEADLPGGRVSALQAALEVTPPPVHETAHPSVALIELLVDRGASVNEAAPATGETPLFGAVSNLAMTQLLIDHGADVNAVDQAGDTPIFNVTSPAVAHLLLAHGARFALQDKRGETPFQAAAFRSPPCPQLVDWFLAHGVQPDVWSMAATGRTAVLRTLLQQNPALANQVGSMGENPMGWAVTFDHVDAVQALLAAGGRPDEPDSQGVPPLFKAIYHPDMLDLLLKRGANPNLRDPRGETPLHRAAADGQTAAVKRLLLSQADVNAADRDGDTPLLAALSTSNRQAHLAVVELLLQAGADVNVRGNVGQTPLSLCHGQPALEALLRSRGAQR